MNMEYRNTIKGAKLLTLYKQHYLNAYPQKLASEYSCWGYFDGLDISDVSNGNSCLFRKKSQSAISDVWYQTAKRVQEQAGFYSQQNIGIFRCEDESDGTINEDEFWKDRKIFLTVCFIQLQNSNELKVSDVHAIRENIEKLRDVNVCLLTYMIFDNADLVLFIQSNSFLEITKKIELIDELSYVKYIHPICGVREESLSTLKKNDRGVFCDSNGNRLINDDVQEIRISVVGDAGTFENELNEKLKEKGQSESIKIEKRNVEYSYMISHENYNIYIKNSDMITVLSLLKSNELLTHQNGLFGNRIYNIETSLQMESRNSDNVLFSKSRKVTKINIEPWCSSQIDQYRKYMDMAWENKDEGLYSYIQTIIQTLNTLSQFENYSMSKNIFYMVYPSFSMFLKQLKKAYESGKIENDRKEIMNTIQNYLESINSIIYHSIHMDQIFLMVPGCSGTSYSIPTKLNMFYLWFLQEIVNILNDSQNQYAFYLAPVMESKPHTHLVNFNFPPGDRLISINLSQRSLFMPRSLIIILAHEIAHYVGDNIRQRKARWERLKRSMAAIIAEVALPYWLSINHPNIEIIHRKKKEIYSYCKAQIQNYMDNIQIRAQNTETMYHASKISSILQNVTLNLLSDENQKILDLIKISSSEQKEFSGSFDDLLDVTETFMKIAHESKIRLWEAVANGTCDIIIWHMVREYQEIFSDLSAFLILDFDMDDYYTAFRISEGFDVTENDWSSLSYKRIKIMKCLQGDEDEDQYNSKDKPKEETDILQYWPNLDFVEIQMKKYLETCRNAMLDLFKNTDKEMAISEVRTALKIFSDSQYTCSKIYNFIDTKAKEYANNTEKKIKKELHIEYD